MRPSPFTKEFKPIRNEADFPFLVTVMKAVELEIFE